MFESLITKALGPALNAVDGLFTSDDERGKNKNELERIKNAKENIKKEFELSTKKLVHDVQIANINAAKETIVADAKGNWFQSSWRPAMMYICMFCILADAFGWLPNELNENAWTLLTIGLGGFIGGRSLEKVMASRKVQ